MNLSLLKNSFYVLLVAVFCVFIFSPLAANPVAYFTVELQTDSDNLNLSNSSLANVKLDIYESTLDSCDLKSGTCVYAHTFSHSVYTNSKGSVTFVKPSTFFLVKVDLTTLQNDVGVDKELVFYYDALQRSDSRTIYAISDVEINYDKSMNCGVRVDIFNTLGKTIKADYTVTPNVVASTKVSLLDSASQVSGCVTVGSIVKYYNYNVEDRENKLELIAEALSSNNISKEYALNLYFELYNSGYSNEYCGTPIIMHMRSLFEDKEFLNQLTTEKQEALAMVFAAPSYIDERTYPLSPTGSDYFIIHYEGDGVIFGTTPTAIYDIYNACLASRGLFVTSLGYSQPRSNSISAANSVYNVYVVDDLNIGWDGMSSPLVQYSSTTTSDMTINLARLSENGLNTSISNYGEGIIAHEYMHAITFSYINTSSKVNFSNPSQWLWFAESFANWAYIRQYGTGTSQFPDYWVNSFLAGPDTPLTSYSYEAVLLPLYIYSRCGGDATVKNIVTNLGVASDAFAAVDFGLNTGTYYKTFNTLFPYFWSANYAPHASYPSYATPSWLASPSVVATYPSYALPNNVGPFTVNNLACEFRGFELDLLQLTWWANIFVTVDLTSGSYSTLGPGGGIIVEDAYGNVMFSGNAEFFTLIYSWQDYIKGCVMVTNYNRSTPIQYKLTIDIFY